MVENHIAHRLRTIALENSSNSSTAATTAAAAAATTTTTTTKATTRMQGTTHSVWPPKSRY